MGSVRSKSESGLKKHTAHSRHCGVASLRGVAGRVAVFGFEGGEARNVIAQSNDGFHLWLIRKYLLAKGHVRVLKTVIRFQGPFKPRQPIAELGVHGVAVGHGIRGDVAVVDVVELREKFGSTFGPDHVCVGDPFAEIRSGESDLVAIDRSSELQAVALPGPGKHLRDPSAIVVDVSRIAGASDIRATAIPDANVVT